MRCILVRHAESTANRDARLQGLSDFPLSEAGYHQAEALRARFHAHGLMPTSLYSSPLARAFETARVAARSWALPIEPWMELQEYEIGVFSGLHWNEVLLHYPDVARQFELTRDWDQVPLAEPA